MNNGDSYFAILPPEPDARTRFMMREAGLQLSVDRLSFHRGEAERRSPPNPSGRQVFADNSY